MKKGGNKTGKKRKEKLGVIGRKEGSKDQGRKMQGRMDEIIREKMEER